MKIGRLPRIFLSAVLAFVAISFSVLPQIQGKAQEHAKEKLSSFTTYFNENEGGRYANIRLSASKIDGIALQPYGEFSFNGVVGKRTKENGYQNAKIISGGEFVQGVGGGVCQVSTTLYNAALLAGLVAVEAHPHSLAVSYVPPSRDAMVSEASDLRLYNPHDETVYFSMKVSAGVIRAAVFGKDKGYSYHIESRTLKTLPPPPPVYVFGDGAKQRPAKDGIESEAYLSTYRGGVLLSVKRLRKDAYAPIGAILTKKS